MALVKTFMFVFVLFISVTLLGYALPVADHEGDYSPVVIPKNLDNRSNREDADYFRLALHLELLELNLFESGIDKFTVQDWKKAGYPGYFAYLITFMRDQEVEHATEVLRILGLKSVTPCHYRFPYTDIKSFVRFSEIATIVGEAAYLGFTYKLGNNSAQLTSSQIFTTEARQNALFKAGSDENPLNSYFDTPLTASQAWTLASPYIVSCPRETPRVPFRTFPALNITIIKAHPETVHLEWKPPKHLDLENLYVAWVNQLTVTFVKYNADESTADVPENVLGTAFVMIVKEREVSKEGPFVPDTNVIAGPGPVYIKGGFQDGYPVDPRVAVPN